jgi:hypothetical protein
MGHRDPTHGPTDAFSNLPPEGVVGGFPQAAHAAEAAQPATSVPGCIADNATTSWEQYWIDLGGEA